MDETRILKMLKEVIEDKNTGIKYWFDIDSYKYARDYPKPLSDRDICRKVDLVVEDKYKSEDALKKRITRFNLYVDERKNGVRGDVNFIQHLGLALTGDEMAFLIPVTLESFSQIVNSIKNQANIGEVNGIYAQLNQVLYLLEVSCFFNYIPDTKEEGEAYFNKLMIEIREDVDRLFGDKPILRKRLYDLIDEVDIIVNSCEIPELYWSYVKIVERRDKDDNQRVDGTG